jgi:hypothetical protein
MRLVLGCGGLWLALSVAANAGDVWTTVADVESVTVRIHWVTVAELRAAAAKVGKRPPSEPLGFSVLRKEIHTGAYACDIYMLHRPQRVDDHATVSLGHEISHCLGLSHE